MLVRHTEQVSRYNAVYSTYSCCSMQICMLAYLMKRHIPLRISCGKMSVDNQCASKVSKIVALF